MSNILFVDTSALAKRYVTEVGSPWLRLMLHPSVNHVVIISAVTTVELPSLLARHVREGGLSAANAALVRTLFLRHVETDYLVVPADNPVFAQARLLVDRYPLRALDAIQLASAEVTASLLSEPITFLGSDRVLLVAASAAGLPTDDPLAHA
ncbi:MAG: hypothetical protein NVSMB65_12210 [Chloroflexota bacterium]